MIRILPGDVIRIVEGNEHITATGLKIKYDDYYGPFANTTHIVLTKNPGYEVVDYGAVMRKLAGRNIPSTGVAPVDSTADEMAECAIGMLNSLATGLAALGPGGAAPATATMALGTLLGFLLPKEKLPPPPPGQAQIEEIMKQALIEQDARHAAAAFASAATSYSDYQKRIQEDPDSGYLANKFSSEVGTLLSSNSHLMIGLETVESSPDIGAHILSSVGLAVSVYLQLVMADLAFEARTDERELGPWAWKQIYAKLVEKRQLIQDLRKRLADKTGDEVAGYGLTGTRQGGSIYWKLYRVSAGTSDEFVIDEVPFSPTYLKFPFEVNLLSMEQTLRRSLAG